MIDGVQYSPWLDKHVKREKYLRALEKSSRARNLSLTQRRNLAFGFIPDPLRQSSLGVKQRIVFDKVAEAQAKLTPVSLSEGPTPKERKVHWGEATLKLVSYTMPMESDDDSSIITTEQHEKRMAIREIMKNVSAPRSD